MPQVKLTARNISTLAAPAEGSIEYFDSGLPGFGLRVSSKDRRTWFARYRVKGYRAKGSLTLGTFPNTDLADARDAAKDALRKAEKGIDPAVPIRQARAADTFKELSVRFMEDYKRRRRSWREKQRIINHDILPAIGKTKANVVKRADVREMLRQVVERESPIMANAVLSLTRRIFNWAIGEEIGGVEHNPCIGIAQPAENVERARVLTTEEIGTLWHGLDKRKIGMPKKIAIALKLELVTAQRKGEVITAEWAELDTKKELVWVIPAAKAKNGLAHRVPLSPLAVTLLGEAKKIAGKSRWVFPSSKRADASVTPRAINKAFTEALKTIGITNARPHDLRRTAASHMTSMSIARFVVGRILNHAERGATSIYDRYGYDAEKRNALIAWGTRLEEIISGEEQPSNVTKLRA